MSSSLCFFYFLVMYNLLPELMVFGYDQKIAFISLHKVKRDFYIGWLDEYLWKWRNGMEQTKVRILSTVPECINTMTTGFRLLLCGTTVWWAHLDVIKNKFFLKFLLTRHFSTAIGKETKISILITSLILEAENIPAQCLSAHVSS